MKHRILSLLCATWLLTACALAESTPTPLPSLVAPTPAQTIAAPTKSATFVLDPNYTVATYIVDETFFGAENRINTAIGNTSKIAGQMILNYDDPAKSAFGTFQVDLSTLKSDSSTRDEMIRRQFLESARFPLATFTIKRVENFPAKPLEGQPIQFNIVGDLFVKQTTREVKWEVNAVLNDTKLVGKAKTSVLMRDFNFEPPNILFKLSVRDGVTITLDFTFLKK